MRPARGLAMFVGVSVGIFAACCALAGSPPVLDRVPAGAMTVVAIPSPAQLHKDIQALATAVETPVPLPGLEDLLQRAGIEKGIDTSKSVALVIMPPKQDAADAADGKDGAKDEKKAGDEEADEGDGGFKPPEDAIFIIPVTSYADLVSNFEVKPGGGIDSGKIKSHDAFFKDLGGGYAAMTSRKELLENFKPGGGAALKDGMGAPGEQIASTSSVVVIVNMDVVRPLGPQAMQKLEEKLASGPAGAGMAGLADFPLFKWAGETLMRDTRMIVAGFKPDAMGVGLDMAVRFNDGSYMSKAMSGHSSAAKLLARLPNQPFLFAAALDLAAPGLRTIVDDVGKQMGATDKEEGLPALFSQMFKSSDGVALLFGTPPGGLMGGLFTSTVSYVKTKSPDQYSQAFKKTLEELNGKTDKGFTYQTSYEAGATEVNGVKVDGWTAKMEAGDDGGGQMAMMMAVVFGPTGGPGGYVAKVEDGVMQTFSKNSLLLGAALDAPKGDNLSKDKLLAQIGERLPRDRVGEAYIGVKSILEQFSQVAALGGMQIDVEIPATLPPVGLGLGTEDGGARFGLYVPAPVIKTVIAVGVQAEQQAGGMGIPRGGGKKDDKNGAGQPRF